MLRWLGQLYARRIVNVNVNIVLAGLLALPPTLLAVWLAHRAGVETPWKITLITFVTDVVADVAIYYTLHWLANHWPALHVLRRDHPHKVHKAHLSFFKDATLVQVERAALSPILYFLFLGTQHVLIAHDWHPVPATVIGFAVGIGTARTLHTLWMLRQERLSRLASLRVERQERAERRLRTGPARGPKTGAAQPPMPPPPPSPPAPAPPPGEVSPTAASDRG